MFSMLHNSQSEPEAIMMEAEVTYKADASAQTVTPPKFQENKKYRLRPINWSNEADIYKKYFRPRAAKWISWIQLTIALATLAAEIMKMVIAQRNFSSMTSLLLHAGGSWGLATLAAGVTVMATYRATYCRLHSAMALHIINAISQYLLVEKIFRDEIPSIRKQLLEDAQEDALIDYEIARVECMRSGYNCTNGYWTNLEKRDFGNLSTFYRIELAIVGIISIYGILQIILSFLMALMTGRALCCGRISLERKFYEIENVDRLHNQPVITIPDTHEIQNQKLQHRKESENSDASFTSPCQSPPPYDSATTTPRSSEDVTNLVANSNEYDDVHPILNAAAAGEKKENNVQIDFLPYN